MQYRFEHHHQNHHLEFTSQACRKGLDKSEQAVLAKQEKLASCPLKVMVRTIESKLLTGLDLEKRGFSDLAKNEAVAAH